MAEIEFKEEDVAGVCLCPNCGNDKFDFCSGLICKNCGSIFKSSHDLLVVEKPGR